MNNSLLRKCPRCKGTIAYDKFYSSHDQFWGWKCLICGEIIDPVILANRRLMRSGQNISTKKAVK